MDKDSHASIVSTFLIVKCGIIDVDVDVVPPVFAINRCAIAAVLDRIAAFLGVVVF